MFVCLQKLLNCLIICSYKTNPSFSSCPWNLRSIGPSDFKVNVFKKWIQLQNQDYRVKNTRTHGKVLSQGIVMWNKQALALNVQKLLARFKFQKGGQIDRRDKNNTSHPHIRCRVLKKQIIKLVMFRTRPLTQRVVMLTTPGAAYWFDNPSITFWLIWDLQFLFKYY